jgi:diaminohydroxyphosphoribosylaminopyrimidine deaminase/5-amino-6-(5-phosphoribosylamino)uracil reductase
MKAGVRHVVIGMIDPNPLVSGKGVRKLRRAGISVVTGVCERECIDLNRPFLRNISSRRPYVHLKVAVTIDGKLGGSRRWITSGKSRQMVHRARSISDAVLVGSGTVLHDNPLLDVRHVRGRNPNVIVLDGRLRVPTNARVFASGADRRVLLCTTATAARNARTRVRELDKLGVRVLIFETKGGHLPLLRLFKTLYRMQIGSVLVEGGERLSGALLEAGLADELTMFVAPAVGGGTIAAFRRGPVNLVQQENRKIERVSARTLGPDLMVTYLYH